MIQAFVACIMLALPLADVSAQNILGRGVLSSGGIGMSTSSGMRMNGSVSQSAIGITRSAQSVGELGYWYTIMQARPGYSVIMIPNIQASIGQQFVLPLMHSTSAAMFAGSPRSFVATIRFNKTMIEILDDVAFEETDTDYIVTLTGSTADTLSTLASLNVRARLGNDTTTQMVIEDFQWMNADGFRPRIELVGGTFSTIGVCVEGGVPRLVRSLNLTSIAAFPNPADVTTRVSIRMQEEAHVRVTIHDLGGQSQLTIDDATLKKGLHTYNVDLETLPSGVYMLRLETPTEVLSHQLIIRK
jgi:hypothetical protein